MISPLAYVDSSAELGKDVTVHPFAYIGKNVKGKNVYEVKNMQEALQIAKKIT